MLMCASLCHALVAFIVIPVAFVLIIAALSILAWLHLESITTYTLICMGYLLVVFIYSYIRLVYANKEMKRIISKIIISLSAGMIAFGIYLMVMNDKISKSIENHTEKAKSVEATINLLKIFMEKIECQEIGMKECKTRIADFSRPILLTIGIDLVVCAVLLLIGQDNASTYY